jgi:hypothetical protein
VTQRAPGQRTPEDTKGRKHNRWTRLALTVLPAFNRAHRAYFDLRSWLLSDHLLPGKRFASIRQTKGAEGEIIPGQCKIALLQRGASASRYTSSALLRGCLLLFAFRSESRRSASSSPLHGFFRRQLRLDELDLPQYIPAAVFLRAPNRRPPSWKGGIANRNEDRVRGNCLRPIRSTI